MEYRPNYSQIYGGRIRSLGMEVTDDMAREISKAVNWAVGQQSIREMNGESRATPAESAINKNRAALSCVDFPEDMTEAYLQAMSLMPKVDQEMKVIPGVMEMLKTLRKKYRLAIVSNYYAWLAGRLKELRLYDCFEQVIISEAVGVEKPDVRIMEIALKELGLPPESCLYVGDHHPLDVFCSKKAGMDCAWIIGDWDEIHGLEPHRADYRIKSIAELTDILCC